MRECAECVSYMFIYAVRCLMVCKVECKAMPMYAYTYICTTVVSVQCMYVGVCTGIHT